MNRDELLDKLAMELAEWPERAEQAIDIMPDRFFWRGDYVLYSTQGSGAFLFTEEDYLQRRAELINEPSRDDAPEWANWKAQDSDGQWYWHMYRPSVTEDKGWDHGTKCKIACLGKIPASHDWRETLQERPNHNEDRTAFDEAFQRGVDKGRKYDGDKPRMELLLNGMPRALEEIGRVLTFGAQKYDDHNWSKVPNLQERYRAAQLRHALAHALGEEHDGETMLYHLAHEACCILFMLEDAMREAER